MKKKIISILILIVIFQNAICMVYADDEEEQIEDLGEALETVATVDEKEPTLNSKSAIVMDRKSKKIIYGKKENKRVAMASTTKIMTAIIVIENANLEDEVTISAKAGGIGGSRLGLKKDDKITVKNLLYGLMMRSGNDAAVALAEYVGGSVQGFAEKMNAKAKELKLQNTHFVTPHGLDDPDHYTTAYELAIITDYAMENEIFAKIVSTQNYTVSINGYTKSLNNTNELLGVLHGVKGVKTGFTNNAGRCLVTCTNRDGFEIITVVLGADTKKFRTTDSIKLIEYTYKNYKPVNITEIINNKFKEWKRVNENRIVIEKARSSSHLNLVFNKLKQDTIPMKLEDTDNINIEVYCTTFMTAPVPKNTVLGKMKIKLKDEVIEIVDIINEEAIERKNKKDYFLDFLDVIA